MAQLADVPVASTFVQCVGFLYRGEICFCLFSDSHERTTYRRTSWQRTLAL